MAIPGTDSRWQAEGPRAWALGSGFIAVHPEATAPGHVTVTGHDLEISYELFHYSLFFPHSSPHAAMPRCLISLCFTFPKSPETNLFLLCIPVSILNFLRLVSSRQGTFKSHNLEFKLS